MIEIACGRARKVLGAPEIHYADGKFHSDGRVIGWDELAAAQRIGGDDEGGAVLDVYTVFRVPTVTWTMGVHAVILGVHRRTGLVKVLRYAVSHEGGREINPSVVEGQIIGGVAQGIGVRCSNSGATPKLVNRSPPRSPHTTYR